MYIRTYVAFDETWNMEQCVHSIFPYRSNRVGIPLLEMTIGVSDVYLMEQKCNSEYNGQSWHLEHDRSKHRDDVKAD